MGGGGGGICAKGSSLATRLLAMAGKEGTC